MEINKRQLSDHIIQYCISPQLVDPEKVLELLRSDHSGLFRSNGKLIDIRPRVFDGMDFGSTHIKGALDLIADGFHTNRLSSVLLEEYATGVVQEFQVLADVLYGIREPRSPHFFLHGLRAPSINGLLEKIKDNRRIIVETLEVREPRFLTGSDAQIGDGLSIQYRGGYAEGWFGIEARMVLSPPDNRSEEDKLYCHATKDRSYVMAKNVFFVDGSKQEMVVLTVQGRKVAIEGIPGFDDRQFMSSKELGEFYARLSKRLGIDPRGYVLLCLQEKAKSLGFEKIKVLKPELHPYAIENHEGFRPNYLPVIKQAGITQESGCYLEARL